MQYHWRAIVRVTGIPTVTEDDMNKIVSVIPGSVQHESGRGSLLLKWRFSLDSPSLNRAIKQASTAWRKAVRDVEGARPECMDFRVFRDEGRSE